MKPLNAIINRFLALDPESAFRLEKLEGKIIHLELLSQPKRLFIIEFKNSRIYLLQDIKQKADITIKATPLSLLHLSLSSQKKRLIGKEVLIEGNLELGQHIMDLFDQMDIDWEEHLSKFIGDIPSHQVGKAARSFKKFTQKVSDTFVRNFNEYIHEEAEVFPAREALQDFFQEVDEIRMDVDRLRARIHEIERNKL